MRFDLEIDGIAEWIRGGGFPSAALQLPEGLKSDGASLADELRRKTGADVFIIGYPCYGACDLFVGFKRYASALVHFGHSPIPSMGEHPDVLFVEVRADVDITAAMEAAVGSLPQRVGLLATVQYVGLLPEAASIIEGTGRTAVIGEGDTRICHPGQVLGCNCSAALSIQDAVDGFLFVGEGDFHPLAAAFGISKPMSVLNPVTGELRTVDDVRDRILRKRFAAIESSRDAKEFIVLVSGKAGQDRMPAAKEICSKLRAAGRKAEIVILDEINPGALIPFRADAYVNTACPRIAMDDSVKYPKPMLTVTEVDHILGNRRWEDYRFDSI